MPTSISSRAVTPTQPITPADRSRVWSDALFAAVAALQAQLSHPDAEVVREAATAILDLEKTRLRHGRELTGTEAGPAVPDSERVGPAVPDSERPAQPDLQTEPLSTEADLKWIERVIEMQSEPDDEDAELCPEVEAKRYELIRAFRARQAARETGRVSPIGSG